MSGDPEFEDFLKRRRPLFRRELDDGLEPPAELDRIVLRQARQAIEADRPLRMFGMPRWAAPVAIAATLVLGLSVVFKTAMPLKDRVPEVTVQPVAQRLDYPQPAVLPPPPASPAPGSPAPEEASPSGAIVVELGAPAAAGLPSSASDSREVARAGSQTQAASAPAAAGDAPAWRQDARTWQAEIERLRARGDTVRADAEQAEYNRQNRALAVSPDR
jgi:hypothetical protein